MSDGADTVSEREGSQRERGATTTGRLAPAPGGLSSGSAERTQPEGTFCLVLHTHLPWVAHHGAWPVGEEWLHQAFTGSWRRVFALLDRLAAEGARDLLTLGVTPVLAAMLDDPYCLRELHTWLGGWQLRAVEAAPRLPELAGYEFRAATECLADLEDRWLTGGLSPVLRPLVDAGVVELLGGPATHPFLPLLEPRVAAGALAAGLDDTAAAAGPGAGRDLGAGVRLRAGPGGPVRGGRRRRFLVDGPRAARRHRRGPAGRRRPAALLRPRPRGHLPGLVAAGAATRAAAGLPRLPHLRPRLGLPPGPGHRPARAAGTRSGRTTRTGPRRRYGRDAADFVDTVPARLRRSPTRATGGRAWSWPRSTPSCSGTGGTRGRRGWRPCCGSCRTRACG